MDGKGPRVFIDEIGRYVGQEVEVWGWVYNSRSSGRLVFVLVRDGTGILQSVVSQRDVPESVWAAATSLTQESSVKVAGLVRADARAPGGYELAVTGLEVVQVAREYPITPKEHGVDFLMDHRHLWLRSRRQHAILRIRSTLVGAVRDFFDSRGFVLVDAPILTPASVEGTTALFSTDYFGTPAYLSQSGQLYMEAAAMAFGRVYCFGPTFRAERSKTRRHLMEFWMVEPEVAYAELDDIVRLAEELVTWVVERVLERHRPELALLERDTAPLERVKPPFARITYDQAIEILRREGAPVEWGADFGGDEETVLARAFDRPVFVTHYPAHIKAFYMKPDPARPEVVLGVDLLAPEGYGEIIGGGQRIDDLDLLLRRMEEQRLPREAYEWYVDLRRYGSVPHAGFGMGIERVLAWICGLAHVREAIPFPRMLYRLYP
ncbi:asparagine--tRNA ligase [Geochorda subterranea]|uniref:Asparagine--tRNA ligase n=1 Tax=Geochorda subterranea TaxID=3109564 RepID=A0ABZ1BP79_9FIRM|nr:asparagine--tRNA ligase [Limnochorda sp. LNt]WRP14636.1 asparagine--tRNA ligase [Limnochorda sp. LNt]